MIWLRLRSRDLRPVVFIAVHCSELALHPRRQPALLLLCRAPHSKGISLWQNGSGRVRKCSVCVSLSLSLSPSAASFFDAIDFAAASFPSASCASRGGAADMDLLSLS